jgi:hypothetical protein
MLPMVFDLLLLRAGHAYAHWSDHTSTLLIDLINVRVLENVIRATTAQALSCSASQC